LTPAQLARLKKLERLQGLDALGMTDPQREQYRSMALSPVQTAEREAMARFGASQQIADIGQGASFRQQQALADTGKAARAEVSKAVAARDAQIAEQQAQQLAALKEQQKQQKAMERQAIMTALGGAVEGGLGAMEMGAEAKMAKQQYEQSLKNMRESGKVIAESTRKMLGITPQMAAVEGMKATDASLGGDGNRAVSGMIPGNEERLDHQQGYNKPVQAVEGMRATDVSLGGDGNRIVENMISSDEQLLDEMLQGKNFKKLLMMYTNPMGAY